MKIFISHITEEAMIALLLKDFIESTFLGQFEVSLITNSSDSAVADKWLVELDGALSDAELLLMLCSPKSIRQPWVHFEFGCAWTKSLQIACLCHSGLNKTGLPSHLRTFEVLEIDEDAFMEQLFKDLAKRFSIKRLPRLSYDTMNAELRATLVSIAHAEKNGERASIRDLARAEPEIRPAPEAPETPPLIEEGLDEEIDETIEEKLVEKLMEEKEVSKPKPKPKPRSSPGVLVKRKRKKGRKKKEAPAEPESVQKRILTLLSDAGNTGYPLEDLSDLLGIVGPKLEPYLDVLKDQAYINISVGVGRPPEYKIAEKGEQYLAETKPA